MHFYEVGRQGDVSESPLSDHVCPSHLLHLRQKILLRQPVSFRRQKLTPVVQRNKLWLQFALLDLVSYSAR